MVHGISRGSASAETSPRKRGCFFWGCLTASIVVILLLLASLTGGYFVYQSLEKYVLQYTDDEPRPLPANTHSADEFQNLQLRMESFAYAVEHQTGEELVLNEKDINMLIGSQEELQELRNIIHVSIQGDELQGQLSLPLEQFGLSGKYLNGSAQFEIRLDDAMLFIFLDEVEVHGNPLPEELMNQLRGENLAEKASRKPEYAQFLQKMESIEIRDGHLYLKTKS